MKRLLLLTMISLLTVSAVGCSTGRNMMSRCRLFGSGNRGDLCNSCMSVPQCAPPCGCPCETSGQVYSQSIPVYNGFGGGSCCDSGCCDSGFGGYSGGFNGGVVYGDPSGYGGCATGNCGGGIPGMQYQPGTVIPGEGMIIDGGAQQIPYLPAPQQAPQTSPAPNTPGPAPGT